MAKIGTGMLDVGEIVEKMIVYQSSHLYHLQTEKQVEQVQMSAYSSLQNLFSQFQNSLDGLTDAFGTIAYTVNSSNGAVATAVANSNDVGLGTHTINVTQLATAQSYSTQATFSSNVASLGFNETLTFANSANPSKNFSLDLTSDMALTDVRDAINQSDNNFGISAAIISSTVSGTTQYSLVLTSQTGLTNEFTINGDVNNDFNFTQASAAQNAKFTFDTYSEETASNIVDTVIDGLTINLAGAGAASLTVVQNTNTNQASDVQEAISNMLSAYNNIITFLDADEYVSMYDEKNKSFASGLNSSFQFIKSQLRSAVNAQYYVSGDIKSISSVGLSLAAPTKVKDQYDVKQSEVVTSGQLTINQQIFPSLDNETTFNLALDNDFDSLNAFFNDPNGFIFNMQNVIDNNIIGSSNTGLISSSEATINQEMDNTDTRIRNENDRLKTVKDALILKYAKLNASMQTYQTLSDYLDKQYEYLNNMYSGND